MKQRTNACPALYRDAIGAAVLGLVCNVLLGVVKLVGGILGQSFALISDAVNSIGDSLSSIVVVGALVYAQRPADNEHPYGHTRAEGVAASNVALLMIVSALYIGWQAFGRLTLPQQPPPMWAFWIAAANVVIKEILYRYKRRIGEHTGSTAVIANAWDHRADALCSAAVFVGLGAVRLGGPAWGWADAAAALVVVAFILVTATRLFRRSVSELLDLQADDDFVREVRVAAEAVDEVRRVETLRIRKSGLEYFADIHVEVDAELTVEDGHRIGHQVKDRLLDAFPCIRDVLVHIEPYPHIHDLRERKGDAALFC